MARNDAPNVLVSWSAEKSRLIGNFRSRVRVRPGDSQHQEGTSWDDVDDRAVEITLSGEERRTLERWARRYSSSQALALRCRIVLGTAEGRSNR